MVYILITFCLMPECYSFYQKHYSFSRHSLFVLCRCEVPVPGLVTSANVQLDIRYVGAEVTIICRSQESRESSQSVALCLLFGCEARDIENNWSAAAESTHVDTARQTTATMTTTRGQCLVPSEGREPESEGTGRCE